MDRSLRTKNKLYVVNKVAVKKDKAYLNGNK